MLSKATVPKFEVRLCERKEEGLGIFVLSEDLRKGTVIGSFSGKVINCFDENGQQLCPRPKGTYVMCLEYLPRGIYLDTSTLPSYGEPGWDRHIGHFANSSHPLLPSPYNEPNGEVIGCPDQPSRTILRTIKDLKKGDQILIDYHDQLVKKKLLPSCGCRECKKCMKTPSWTADEMSCKVISL